MSKYNKHVWRVGEVISAELLNTVENQLEMITPGATTIADEYNLSTTYEVGDYCLYNGGLWRCIAQSTGNAPEEGMYWTNTILVEELNNGVDASIASAYSTTKTYHINDYVIYDNKLYRNIYNGTTSGSWNSDKWEETILTDDVTDALDALDGLGSAALDTAYEALAAATSAIDEVEALTSDIADAIASIPADYSDLLATIASDFSSSTAYAAGDYVWYDGDLYKFTADHSGSWTGMDVVEVVIGDELTGLKSATNSVIASVATYGKNRWDFSKYTVGYLGSDGNIISNDGWRTTDFCYVEGFSDIICSCKNSSNVQSNLSMFYLCTYDSTRTFIERLWTTGSYTASLDANVAYVRFSYNSWSATEHMLESGTVKTTYEPYSYTMSYHLITDKTLTQENVAADAKTVGDNIEGISSAIENIENKTETIENNLFVESTETPTFTNIPSKYIASNGTVSDFSSASWGVTSSIDVTEYYQVKVTASGGYGSYCYAFYDSSDNFISGSKSASGGTSSVTDEIAQVPQNAEYLVAAHYSDFTVSVTGYKKQSKIDTIKSEVEDIRIGYDDVVYQSAGSAVRSQISSIHNILDGNYYMELSPVSLTLTTKKYINRLTGEIGDLASNYWCVSDAIDVIPDEKYVFNGTMFYNNGVIAFYDANNNTIAVIQATEGSRSGDYFTFTDFAIIVPQNSAAMRIGVYTEGYPYNLKKFIGYKVGDKKFSGKKWVVIGDSLTEHNSRTTMNYHDYIADITGITVVNMGASGTGYRNGAGGTNTFYNRVANVPTDADVVTIFGSFNDGLTDLGTATDTGTTTVGSCINTTIDNLYAVMPVVQLGIVSPTPWVGANPYNHSEANTYADLLEAICKRRSIPFLNLYYESNLRPWDATFRALAYSKDEGNGVHPDEVGHKIIASRFEGFLDSLLLAN